MILLDANILLELLIAGRPQKALVARWLERNRQPFCISMLTVHLVLHFGLKDGLTVTELQQFLADYPKIALLPEDYVTAMEMLADTDHEDALQAAVAKRAGCTQIATLDKKFVKAYRHRFEFASL